MNGGKTGSFHECYVLTLNSRMDSASLALTTAVMAYEFVPSKRRSTMLIGPHRSGYTYKPTYLLTYNQYLVRNRLPDQEITSTLDLCLLPLGFPECNNAVPQGGAENSPKPYHLSSLRPRIPRLYRWNSLSSWRNRTFRGPSIMFVPETSH